MGVMNLRITQAHISVRLSVDELSFLPLIWFSFGYTLSEKWNASVELYNVLQSDSSTVC